MHTTFRTAISSLLTAIATLGQPALADRATAEAQLDKVILPPGFSISVYAEVPGARQIAISNALGTVFVGTRGDKVYALQDRDRNHIADEVMVFAEGLKSPSGVAFGNGFLYVSEQHRLTAYAAPEFELGRREMMAELIYEGFPDSPHHGTRYTRVAPDGSIYVALGVPCNICEPSGNADSILRFPAGKSEPEVFASGVRHSVGMDFHPVSGQLFFHDNGVDMLGDDLPPGELNHAPRAGLHFGFPYYAGGDARHPDWAGRKPPKGAQQPVVKYQAHVAPLGLHFYEGKAFPGAMHHDAFAAHHGSWNRSTPVGYAVVRVKFNDQGMPESTETFAGGFLPENDVAWGRPVDIAELPDGSLLVSDDYQGVIYRIAYDGS